MTKKALRNLYSRKGFTLIELMIVAIIIGVLSAIIIPSFGAQIEKAKEHRAVAEISSMKTIIDLFYIENGAYPNEEELQNILIENGINWTGDSNGIKDPWGNNYTYAKKANEDLYVIFSGNYGKSDEKYVLANELKEAEAGIDSCTYSNDSDIGEGDAVASSFKSVQ